MIPAASVEGGDQTTESTSASEPRPADTSPYPSGARSTIPANATVLVLQVGGLGDLVLTSELIGGLTQAREDIRIMVMCRAEFAGVVDLYPVRPAEVLPLRFNPYVCTQSVEELHAELASVVTDLREQPPEVFIAASLNPTWLSWFITAALQPPASVSCTRFTPAAEPLTAALTGFGLAAREITNLPPPPSGHERERYQEILRHLGVASPASAGAWKLPAGIAVAAQKFLSDRTLEEHKYVACFPGGSASTHVKRWPEERFTEVLNAIQRETGLPVLLIGDQAEAENLTRIATILQPAGRTFCGGPEDVPLLAALLAKAAAWLGNDTGPMHLASAYGVPGVAIYGGGHWPAYAPWGKGSVGVVHPLPCFSCDWDCVFGRGLCVTSIPSGVVLEALRNAITHGNGPARVETVASLPPAVHEIVSDAARRYQVVRDQARFREEKLVQLTRIVAERDKRFVEVEKAATERLAMIHELTRIVEDQRSVFEGEEALSATIAGMKELVARQERQIQELDTAARERLANIEQLTRAITEREQYNAELERAAMERLTALESTDAERRRLEEVATDQGHRIDALTQCIQQLNTQLGTLHNETVIHFFLRRFKLLLSRHS